jgi:pimeloyl-ACP methyl ester carboxylesterase
MERRVFLQTAAKALAVVPWLTPYAKGEPSTSAETENGSKGGSTMSNYTHNTVPTEFIEANGIRFAYRRFGKKSGVPIVFNMHLNGNMDMWDPAVTDGLAKEREVILFDNAGVGSSTGEVPTNFADMAKNAIAFIEVLGLHQVDIFGFSIGGMVAQNIVTQRPDLVRKLVLVGTGPRNGDSMQDLSPEAKAIIAKTYNPPMHIWLDMLFSPTPASQAAGLDFLERIASRTENRDKDVNEKVGVAQVAAVMEWGKPVGERFAYLKDIKAPTLVVAGNHEVIVYTINSLHLAQNIPNAKLIVYPDSNHGSYNQYHEEFVFDTNRFLNS